jgi:hypothetical protein
MTRRTYLLSSTFCPLEANALLPSTVRAAASLTSSPSCARTVRSNSSPTSHSSDSRPTWSATSPSALATRTLSPRPTTIRSSTPTTSPREITEVVSLLLDRIFPLALTPCSNSRHHHVPASEEDRRDVGEGRLLPRAGDAPVPKLPRSSQCPLPRRQGACMDCRHSQRRPIGSGECSLLLRTAAEKVADLSRALTEHQASQDHLRDS